MIGMNELFTECVGGYYGEKCHLRCHRCYSELCHKVTGQCLKGCKERYAGVNCEGKCIALRGKEK